nr:uncharacterized protein LOC123861740 isoform X6 [Mirounga angustirostris]
MMRTTNTASVPKSRLQTSVPEPKSRRSTFHAGARVCCDASIAFVWRRPIGGGPSPGRPRKGGESRTSSWGGSLDSGGRAGPVGLGVHARESSVMSVHAVMRALRKNKTLRYGVPMLIDPELEKKLKMNKVSLESEYELSSTCHWQKQSPRAALSTWLMLPTDI